MSFPFLGTAARTYTQYLDTATWQALQARPGGEYDMVPAPGAGEVAIPPSDGLWGPQATSEQVASPRPGKTAKGTSPSPRGE